MLHFLFSHFPQIPGKFQLLAFVLVLLVGLAVVFFWQEPLKAKIPAFSVIAVLVGFVVWKLI